MLLMQDIAADVSRVRSERHFRGFHERIIQGIFYLLRSRNRSSVGAVNKVDRDLKGYLNLLFLNGGTADFQPNSWGQKFDALKGIVSQDEHFFESL